MVKHSHKNTHKRTHTFIHAHAYTHTHKPACQYFYVYIHITTAHLTDEVCYVIHSHKYTHTVTHTATHTSSNPAYTALLCITFAVILSQCMHTTLLLHTYTCMYLPLCITSSVYTLF